MPIILLRALIVFGTSAVALLVASLLLDGFHLTPVGLVTATAIFTVIFLITTPVVASLLKQYANGAAALTGLASAFLALLLTALLSDNLTITGTSTWILATVIVWLAMIVVRFLFGAVFRERLRQT